VVLVFEAGGDGLVELEVGGLGFDVCPLAAKLFQHYIPSGGVCAQIF
jgi:hypothetical protein